MSDPATPPENAPGPVSWADADRASRFAAWLARTGPAHRLVPATLRIASADASFRRYLRIDDDSGKSFIVMDAPPAKEDCRPFVQVAQLMQAAGPNVPRVLDWDEPQGFMLITDLGTRTMIEVVDREHPDANRALYMAAVDALIGWQLASRPGVLPAYDEALLKRELALFPDWYLAQHRGIAVEGKV